jgi:hypothetical protein
MPSEVPANPTSPARKPRPPRWRRRLRRGAWASVIVTAALLALAWFLTQGAVPRWLLTSAVRDRLGAELTLGGVGLAPDGTLHASAVRLSLPESAGVKGPARELLTAERVIVELDWSGWWMGRTPSVVSVNVDAPIIRISQSTDGGGLNISKLRAASASGGATGGSGAGAPAGPPTPGRAPSVDAPAFPLIRTSAGVVQFGEHDDAGAYKGIVAFGVYGWMVPVPGKGQRAAVRVLQLEGSRRSGELGLSLAGEIDLGRGEGRLSASAVDLANWRPEQVPSALRDLWRDLDMRGAIAGTDVVFSPTGVGVDIRLERVGINLPIPAGQLDVVGGRTVRMEGVGGHIRFGPTGVESNLVGQFSGVECALDFRLLGNDFAAPYRAQIFAKPFRLSDTPRLLWYLQPVVRRMLDEQFGSPDARIEAQITISRGEPMLNDQGQRVGAPPEITGDISFRDGSAVYAGFPYAFRDLQGQVRFSRDEVRVVGIRGKGPTGAGLFIEGLYAPPDEDGALDVRMTLTDVAIDDAAFKALDAGPGGRLVGMIFSRHFDQLLRESGLLNGRAFTLGGVASTIELGLSRPRGPGQKFAATMRLEMPTAGVLSKDFPYPVVAKGMRATFENGAARITCERASTLDGAPVTLDAFLPFPRPPRARTPEQGGMDVRIGVTGVAIDPLLLWALPGGEYIDWRTRMREAGHEQRISLAATLRRLGMRGTLDAEARIVERDDYQPGYSVRVRTRDVSLGEEAVAFKGPLAPEAQLARVVGTIDVSDRGISTEDFRIELFTLPTLGGLPLSGAPPTLVPIDLRVDARFPEEGSDAMERGEPAQVRMSVDAPGLALGSSLERLVARVSPNAGGFLARLRQRLNPTGQADLHATIDGVLWIDGDQLDVRVDLAKLRDVSLDLLDGRLASETIGGGIGVSLRTTRSGPVANVRLRFDELTAPVTFDAETVGVVRIDGEGVIDLAHLDSPARALRVFSPLEISLRGVDVGSPLLKRTLAMAEQGSALETLTSFNVRGSVDASIALTPGPEKLDSLGDWSVRGTLQPLWLAMENRGRVVEVPLVSGQIRFDDQGGDFEQFTLVHDRWDMRLNGRWQRTGEGPTRGTLLDTEFFARAGRLEPTLLALLPSSVERTLTNAGVDVQSGVDVAESRVRLTTLDDGRASTDVRARIRFGELGADVGIALERVTGELDLHLEKALDDAAARATLNATAQSMIASGVTLADASATILVGHTPGRVDVTSLTGVCSSGRLSARASLAPDADGIDRYQVQLSLAGVRFADILRDIQRNAEAARQRRSAAQASAGVSGARATGVAGVGSGGAGVAGPFAGRAQGGLDPGTPPPSRGPISVDITRADVPGYAGDLSRGSLDAELALAGRVGDNASRRGRGWLRIAGGDVIRLPLVVPLINLLNLQLPIDDRLDYFHATAWIAGNTLEFDELGLLSNGLSILGWGSMELPSLDVDLRFITRGTMRIPILSDLLEALRNEIVTTSVRGTLNAPEIGNDALLGARRLMSGTFRRSAVGRGVANGVEQRLREERSRLRRLEDASIRGLPVEGPRAEATGD